MATIALDESSLSARPARRWIALLALLLAGSLIVLTVYGVVYERETKGRGLRLPNKTILGRRIDRIPWSRISKKGIGYRKQKPA